MVPTSRVPTLTALFLALLLGAAPWRVCAHGEHGGMWMPAGEPHAHADGGGCGASHGHAQVRGAAACAQRHGSHVHGACAHRCSPRGLRQCGAQRGGLPVQAEPLPGERGEGEDHQNCHCDDQPLVVGLRLAPIEVAAPQLTGWLHSSCGTLLSADPTAIEPRPLARGRVACEEDSIVLLR